MVSGSEAAQLLESAGVAPDRLAEAARRGLAAAPGFAVGPARDGDRRLLVQLTVERAEAFGGGPGAGAVAQVAVSLELTSADGEPSRREAGAAAEPLSDGPAALRVALERAATAAVDKAVAGVALQLGAERKSSPELVRDLTSPDAPVRDRAVRTLADRGAREAVPALIERLHDSDPAVVERAIGALAQLHDPRAAAPLIALARHRDGAYVAQLARLLGDVGGPDARAWLLTMSSGHPDDAVRGAARAALAELSERERQARADPR
ncbi:HEAT repeat domain-containing protein [Anaeromyxobacter diazotrophicus]|uniref:HEAT repeat domain-containing protein n=1 Tax=Anaeromyxobacter diazotrophicus TaxID=2590199 RepID=UPI001591E1E7|nr:HEAT repeat domain-containing protein [Anaeromyxobacter diazotrophicus]